MRRIHLFALCLILVAGMSRAGVAAGEFVVIGATGDAPFKAGQVLSGTDSLTIAEGATVTLIASSGAMISVVGPHDGVIPAAGSPGETTAARKAAQADGGGDVLASLSRLFSQSDKSDASLGAFRTLGRSDTTTDPWLIDVTRPGDHCFRGGEELILWRAKLRRRSVMSITDVASGDEAQVKWGSYGGHQPWPMQALKPTDGANYKILTIGRRRGIELILHQVPKDLPSPLHIAAWMAQNRCDRQAKLLIGSLEPDVKVGGGN